MKTGIKTILALVICLSAGFTFANAHGEGKEHGESDKLIAPNGGRIIKVVEPHAEIFVAEDGLVRVTFLDQSGAAIPPTEQEVSLVGGDRMNPIKLSFSKEGNSFVSQEKLPLDETIPVVVQIKTNADAKMVRDRFNLNMGNCSSCDNREYACVCHDEDED